MLNKKAISIFMTIALIFVVLLAGCSSSSSSSNKDSGEGKTVIKFMHLWPEGSSNAQYKIVDSIIKDYEKEHSNVKIETEILGPDQYRDKIKVLAASNELPDVGMTWSEGFLKPYVEGNMFAPLDDVIERSGLKDSFIPGVKEAYAVDGKTYALPLEMNVSYVFYNKEIFKKYHLDVPNTYEDFKKIVKTLVDHNVVPVTVGNKEGWPGSLWWMYLVDRIGGPDVLTNAVDRQASFEDPALVKAAEEIQKLVDMGAFVKGNTGLSNDEAKGYFMNEQAAMFLTATWELPNYTTSPDVSQEFKDKVGYFKFPVYEGGKSDTSSYVGGPGVGLFVAEDSPVKEQAKDFVSYFVKKWGEKSVTEAGVIPGTKVDPSGKDLHQMYVDVLNDLNNASNVTTYVDVQMSPSVSDLHHNMITALFGKQVTPEKFCRKQEQALKEEEK